MYRPVIGRTGSKYPILKTIFKYMPDHKIYVEPFAGSAVVWLNKDPEDINVINDLDPFLKKEMSLIKKAPVDADKYTRLETVDETRAFYNKSPKTPADRLHHLRIEQNSGFSSTPINGNPERILNRQNINLDRLIKTKVLLKNTIVLNEDYERVVKKYDSVDTFFFIDPPYDGTSAKGFGYAEGNEFDYDEFYNVVSNIRGMFMITINDSTRFRKMFNKYIIKKITVSGIFQNAPDRKELIIMNYKL